MYYDNFKRLCDEKGVRPGTVARETGISTATITAWKQNKYTPKQDKLQKIADYFDVSVDYMMKGIDVPIDDEVRLNDFVFYYGQLNDEQKTLVDNLIKTFLSKQ